MTTKGYGAWPIYGHELQVKILRQAADADALSHAYLIYGQRGLGKKYLTSCLLKQLLCDQHQVDCQACVSCKLLAKRQHPDISILPLPQTTGISVADIRQALNFASRTSYRSGGYKCVVIERAEYLTTEAANALLKTLEEAPPQVIYFLIAENIQKIPSTVRSRCSLLKLLPLPETEMRAWLKQYSVSAELEETIIRLAMGRPGRALDLIGDNLAAYQTAFRRSLNFLSGTAASNFNQLKTWLDTVQQRVKRGESTNSVEASLEEVNFLELALRDLIFAKINSSFMVNGFAAESLLTLAGKLTLGALLRMMAALRQLRYNIQRNLNVTLAWEYFFLQINDLKQIYEKNISSTAAVAVNWLRRNSG